MPAPLEINFFKVNGDRLALIVDWIDRDHGQTRSLRVNIRSPGGRKVIVQERESWSGENYAFLDDRRTFGRTEDVEWDLCFDRAAPVFRPGLFPLTGLGLLDMEIESRPSVRMSGWIRHGLHYEYLYREPGLRSRYWGRQLPAEWWWVAATRFDRPDIAVEATLLRSGLWGLPVRIPAGYLYLRIGDRIGTWLAPLCRHAAEGSPDGFELRFQKPFGPPVRLIAFGRDYCDWGDRIINTLTGDLEVWCGDRLLARCRGVAGLERRFPEK